MPKLLVAALALSCIFAGAAPALAHEVYVLDEASISHDLTLPPPDFIATIESHLAQFVGWGTAAVLVVLAVFFVSVSRPVERLLDRPLRHLKRYAPAVAQATLGAAMLASGYYGAAFGVELPFSAIGPIDLFRALFAVCGGMLLFGVYPRIGAAMAVGLFAPFALKYGAYMLNYLTYLGEALAILALGSGYSALGSLRLSSFFERGIMGHLHGYKFLFLRACFGVSLIYASAYAKFLHGSLALDTVTRYNLTAYFPFDPVFLVLGAMLVEILLGLFFLLGFEVRFASLFFLTFLSLSLAFFGEAVWPHIILIGTAIAMFTHGYDRHTLTSWLTRRRGGRLEPTL